MEYLVKNDFEKELSRPKDSRILTLKVTGIPNKFIAKHGYSIKEIRNALEKDFEVIYSDGSDYTAEFEARTAKKKKNVRKKNEDAGNWFIRDTPYSSMKTTLLDESLLKYYKPEFNKHGIRISKGLIYEFRASIDHEGNYIPLNIMIGSSNGYGSLTAVMYVVEHVELEDTIYVKKTIHKKDAEGNEITKEVKYPMTKVRKEPRMDIISMEVIDTRVFR